MSLSKLNHISPKILKYENISSFILERWVKPPYFCIYLFLLFFISSSFDFPSMYLCINDRESHDYIFQCIEHVKAWKSIRIDWLLMRKQCFLLEIEQHEHLSSLIYYSGSFEISVPLGSPFWLFQQNLLFLFYSVFITGSHHYDI